MTDSRASFRYVKSLLGLAIEQNAVEQVHNDMLMFSRIVDNNRDFRLMLRNPVIKHDTKRAILEKIFKGKVHSPRYETSDPGKNIQRQGS
jgi:F-type H+-transporting ATPase subunit delta